MFSIFFPVGQRDEMTDFFFLCPSIFVLNIVASFIFLFEKKDKGKGILFLINALVATTMFIVIQNMICHYVSNNISEDFFFYTNKRYDIKIYNFDNSFVIRDESYILYLGHYKEKEDAYNLIIDDFCFDSIHVAKNDTLIIRNSSLYNWDDEPIYVIEY